MARHLMIVSSEPRDGAEDEFNRFQTDEHVPDVVAAHGFVAAQRFVIAELQPEFAKGLPDRRYLTLYEIEGDLAAAIHAVEAGRRSEGRRMSDTMRPDWTCMMYTAISSRIPRR